MNFDLGDRAFIVERHICRSNRLTMIDDRGNTWYRYETPLVTYDILEYKVIGKLSREFHGVAVDDPVFTPNPEEVDIHLEALGPYQNRVVVIPDATTHIFSSRQLAEEYLDAIKQKDREVFE